MQIELIFIRYKPVSMRQQKSYKVSLVRQIFAEDILEVLRTKPQVMKKINLN